MVTKYTIGCLSLLLLLVTIVVANDVNRARIYNRQLLKTSQNIITTDTQATDLYFSQTLDHFVPLNSQETFQQRYYVNNSFWKENGPAFLIIGGEGELRSSSVVNGEIVELAQKYGAILFSLEHRFYGESSPFDTLDSDTLPYLTTQQALSDLVNFRSSMVTAYNISETIKWAIFGCSYSGALSAWFRLKFPNLAVASFSGSSPVEAILSFYHYDQVISTSLGSECAAPIRNATLQIQQLLLDPTTNAQIKTRLQCESIDDNVAVLYAIADAIAFVVQYNYNIKQVCTNFTTSENVVDTYVDFLNFFYTSTGTSCYDLDIAGFTNQTYNPAGNMRQWMWQSCDELGYFQTAPAENSLRSPLIDANWHIQVCKTLFGDSAMGPKIAWTNEYYGAKDLITSNTIFTNGQLDPWQVLSVTSSLSPSVPSILVADVAHCANWYAPSPSDPQGLVDSRSQVSSYLGAFLNSCDGGCGEQGVCTFTRKGNDVSSKCACINGKSGHHCNQEPIPWWSLLVLGLGVFFLSIIIGVFVGMKFCRSRNYTSI